MKHGSPGSLQRLRAALVHPAGSAPALHRGELPVFAVGELIAKKAVAKGISKVVFDRGGYLYHRRVRELAEAAREAGLKF